MKIHFLNVDEGDCSIVEHDSGRITMVDICCGNLKKEASAVDENDLYSVNCSAEGLKGNFNQKEHPVNPLDWLSNLSDGHIFRFIATHPDMDHLDGLKALFCSKYKPTNFWYTENDKEMDSSKGFGKYSEDDWKMYKKLMNGEIEGVTNLSLKRGATGRFYNQDDNDGNGFGDQITVISPSNKINKVVSETENFNDGSYVLLMESKLGHKVLFCGDSEKQAWNDILESYGKELRDIDVLIAPHHGRKSGGNDDYLDVLKPKFSLLGNAKSDHLDYSAWNNRGLIHYTNNQLGSVVLEETRFGFDVFASNKNAVLAYHQGLSKYFTEDDLKLHDSLPTYFLRTIQ